MATFVEFINTYQVAQTAFNVIRNARQNAELSKVEVLTQPVADVAAVHNANADNYLFWMDKITANGATITAALTALGVDVPNITPLRTAFQTYRDAPKNNANQITTAADDLIAALPSQFDLWD